MVGDHLVGKSGKGLLEIIEMFNFLSGCKLCTHTDKLNKLLVVEVMFPYVIDMSVDDTIVSSSFRV